MINENAIYRLLLVRHRDDNTDLLNEALEMAIEALRFVADYHQTNIEAYAHDMGVSLEQAERELRVEPKNDDSGSVEKEMPEIKTDRTNDDLISRQDAIYHCKKRLYQTAEVNKSVDVYVDIAENRLSTWLNELPSAQPEQRWIPVNERLPKIGQDVWISTNKYTAEGCYRADGNWTQFRWSTVLRADDVIAWMPLPEPYKGDES